MQPGSGAGCRTECGVVNMTTEPKSHLIISILHLSRPFGSYPYSNHIFLTMSSNSSQTVHSKGIYHGLPTYQSNKPQIAIITGANGISGFHTLRVLANAPDRWSKIYALSRRPPPPRLMDLLGSGKERVEHVACDFLNEPQAIADIMKAIITRADAIFFYSYLQPGENMLARFRAIFAKAI